MRTPSPLRRASVLTAMATWSSAGRRPSSPRAGSWPARWGAFPRRGRAMASAPIGSAPRRSRRPPKWPGRRGRTAISRSISPTSSRPSPTASSCSFANSQIGRAHVCTLVTNAHPFPTPPRFRSHGVGDLVLGGPPSQLTQSWFRAGPLGRFPAAGQSDGFSAYWLGTPTVEAPAEMAWTARAHSYLAQHFPHLKPTQPYRVFLQFREQPPFGGATALHQSFMLARGPLRE